MINPRYFLSRQMQSLAGGAWASRLPCGRLRLALTPRRRRLPERHLAEKKKCEVFVGPMNPKVLPMSPNVCYPSLRSKYLGERVRVRGK